MIGFVTPNGERFQLIGSHTSTALEGRQPFRKPGCWGCHLSPLERAKASHQPMRSLDEIVGLERERRPA